MVCFTRFEMNKTDKLEIAKQKLESFKRKKQQAEQVETKLESNSVNIDLASSPMNQPTEKSDSNPNLVESYSTSPDSTVSKDAEIQSLKLYIQSLETKNAILNKQLAQEQRLVVLLQAEVEAMPDLISKFHIERSKLLKRVNGFMSGTQVGVVGKVVEEEHQMVECGACKGVLIKL